jgi:hypothetical protein
MISVTFHDGDLSIKGHEDYLSPEELRQIVGNFLSNYPKGTRNENVNTYYSSLTSNLENYLNSRIANMMQTKQTNQNKKAALESWNVFPSQYRQFVANNPMVLRNKLRHLPKNLGIMSNNRRNLARRYMESRSKVFPVTRKRKNRKTRKSN